MKNAMGSDWLSVPGVGQIIVAPFSMVWGELCGLEQFMSESLSFL